LPKYYKLLIKLLLIKLLEVYVFILFVYVRKFRAGFSEKCAKSLLTQICAEKNMRNKRKKRNIEVNESSIEKKKV
jgi:hypothetical protein